VRQRPALIATVHDPERRLLPMIEGCGEALAAYPAVYVFATEHTDPQVLDALRAGGVSIDVGPAGASGVGQRHVLVTAVAAGHEHLFYCDVDRWLHWAGSFPQELSRLAGRIEQDHADAWYVCLGRTDRAFRTHPLAQTLPETITNRALSTVAGRRLDATAGAAWIRSAGARLILAGSTVTTKATDLEWPGLIIRADRKRVQGAFLEGLEFETADAWPEEIARLGSVEAWMQDTYDQPRTLRDRLQLAADSITALMEVTGES